MIGKVFPVNNRISKNFLSGIPQCLTLNLQYILTIYDPGATSAKVWSKS